MITKLILILPLLVGCGQSVNINNKNLIERSQADPLVSQNLSPALLLRGKPDKLQVNGTAYPISLYSAQSALEFIASKPLHTQMSVSYKGYLKDKEIVIEILK